MCLDYLWRGTDLTNIANHKAGLKRVRKYGKFRRTFTITPEGSEFRRICVVKRSFIPTVTVHFIVQRNEIRP